MENPSEDKLTKLMNYIGERYVFSNDSYPGINLSTHEKIQTFAISHSLMHIVKSAGKIATQTEASDHGSKIDIEELRVATAKMLINTLKLAQEIGMNSDDLVEMVPKIMKNI